MPSVSFTIPDAVRDLLPTQQSPRGKVYFTALVEQQALIDDCRLTCCDLRFPPGMRRNAARLSQLVEQMLAQMFDLDLLRELRGMPEAEAVGMLQQRLRSVRQARSRLGLYQHMNRDN